MPYTEAEEAFINATIPVLELSEEMISVSEDYNTAAESAAELADALPEGGDVTSRIHELVLEAARRVGFDSEHRVVVGLNQGYAELVEYERQLDALAEAAARASARELLGITDEQLEH